MAQQDGGHYATAGQVKVSPPLPGGRTTLTFGSAVTEPTDVSVWLSGVCKSVEVPSDI